MVKERYDGGVGAHDKYDGIKHAWKAEYSIGDNARKCNVNFHYGLIEPDQKILTYAHFKNSVLLVKINVGRSVPNEQKQREKYSLSP